MCYEYRPLYIYCDSGTGEINGTFPKRFGKVLFYLFIWFHNVGRGDSPDRGNVCYNRVGRGLAPAARSPNSENFAPAAKYIPLPLI